MDKTPVIKIAFSRDAAKGRGTAIAPGNRFAAWQREAVDDGWDELACDGEPAPLKTRVTARPAKSIISRNQSPDLPFTQSINPYYGCEHGCVYCYARPSYAYWDLSPGVDFETQLFAKTNAADLLRQELARPSYRCSSISLGANTDCYQPIEREWKITRSVLEVLAQCDHPVGIVTKSALVERDIDLLGAMAQKGLAKVFVSLGTLNPELARRLEPRAAAPHRRLRVLETLAKAGIPVGVMVAALIPGLNDADMEASLEAARDAGATEASYVLLRLPLELKEVFRDWLHTHVPERAAHVMSLIQQSRGGKDYDADWSQRMTGTGVFAELIAQRFKKACARLELNERRYPLDTSQFRAPLSGKTAFVSTENSQQSLF